MKALSSNKTKSLIFDIILTIGMIILGLIMMMPFFWMLSVSFEQTANINPPFPPRLIPENFSIFNYKIVFENGGMASAYKNSFIVAVGQVSLRVISAILAGYAFSKGKFKFKKVIFILILSTMMIPEETRLIPMYIMFHKANLLNTFAPIIFPGLIYGFGVLLSKQFFDKLPDSLKEAAEIDGAGNFRTFFQVFLPLTGPITATMIILAFRNSWNAFLWPRIVITSQKLNTIPIYLASFSQEERLTYPGLTMALAAAGLLPLLIVFLFLQKYVIQSIALSGLKGE